MKTGNPGTPGAEAKKIAKPVNRAAEAKSVFRSGLQMTGFHGSRSTDRINIPDQSGKWANPYDKAKEYYAMTEMDSNVAGRFELCLQPDSLLMKLGKP